MTYPKPALRQRAHRAIKCDTGSGDAAGAAIPPETERPRRRPRTPRGDERQVHFIDEGSPRSGPVTSTRLRPRTSPRERRALFYTASDYAYFELEEARRASRRFGWEDLLPKCFNCEDESVEVSETKRIGEVSGGGGEDGDLAGMLCRVNSFQEQ